MTRPKLWRNMPPSTFTLAGIPVARELVQWLADNVDDPTSTRLHRALSNETRLLALEIHRARGDPPPSLTAPNPSPSSEPSCSKSLSAVFETGSPERRAPTTHSPNPRANLRERPVCLVHRITNGAAPSFSPVEGVAPTRRRPAARPASPDSRSTNACRSLERGDSGPAHAGMHLPRRTVSSRGKQE